MPLAPPEHAHGRGAGGDDGEALRLPRRGRGRGRLVGIITDGDLRRALEPGAAAPRAGLLARTAGEVMTRSPRTIGPDALAAEALRAMDAALHHRALRGGRSAARRSASCTSTTCCARAWHEHGLPASAAAAAGPSRDGGGAGAARARARRLPPPAAAPAAVAAAARAAARAARPPAHLSSGWPSACCRRSRSPCSPWWCSGRRSRATRSARACPSAASRSRAPRRCGWSSPRYQGVDELNRPYTVTARVAQQAGRRADPRPRGAARRHRADATAPGCYLQRRHRAATTGRAQPPGPRRRRHHPPRQRHDAAHRGGARWTWRRAAPAATRRSPRRAPSAPWNRRASA